uniref:Pentatricopeptide repeat-containing protein n=1 Tax=Chenopodium quinoa TaxID=63459 RepID=A0A803NC89_CHEQI
MAAITYLQNLLQYCARNCLIVEGKACHAQIIRASLGVDTLTSNMLINLYCKCSLLHPARQLFDKMPKRSLVSWNTMIGAYTQNGRADYALSLFVGMQREESPLSEFTVSSVLCACAAKSAVFECRQLHAFAASWVFESLEEKSDVTWSSMVAGYVRNELYEEALRLYHRGLGALTEGNQVNATLFKSDFGASVFVASSLVDMYAKCGAIKEAFTVFSDQDSKNVVSWNAMISGFSSHGRCLEAMILFEKMQQTGLYPNEVTYLSVLSACGHMGLVKEGHKYFDLMMHMM